MQKLVDKLKTLLQKNNENTLKDTQILNLF